MTIFNCFKNFPIKLFLGVMFYPSFFNRCYFINRNHKFLKEVSIDRNSVIKILIVEKIYIRVSSKKISQAMLERAEVNMSMCASFNPRSFSCPKMIVAVLHFTRAETFIYWCQFYNFKIHNSFWRHLELICFLKYFFKENIRLI